VNAPVHVCSPQKIPFPSCSPKVLATQPSDTSDTHLAPPEKKSSNILRLFLVLTPKWKATLLCQVGENVSVLIFSFELSHSTIFY